VQRMLGFQSCCKAERLLNDINHRNRMPQCQEVPRQPFSNVTSSCFLARYASSVSTAAFDRPPGLD
jgi:hypothetical protein